LIEELAVELEVEFGEREASVLLSQLGLEMGLDWVRVVGSHSSYHLLEQKRLEREVVVVEGMAEVGSPAVPFVNESNHRYVSGTS